LYLKGTITAVQFLLVLHSFGPVVLVLIYPRGAARIHYAYRMNSRFDVVLFTGALREVSRLRRRHVPRNHHHPLAHCSDRRPLLLRQQCCEAATCWFGDSIARLRPRSLRRQFPHPQQFAAATGLGRRGVLEWRGLGERLAPRSSRSQTGA